MDDLAVARAIHVLSVVHWIGGVAMVTAVILPAVARLAEPGRRLALFDAIEKRFSMQAKVSVPLAGISGFYMTERLGAWDRFADPAFWWMHAMVLVWTLFMVALFVAEPLFLHRWFRARAATAPERTFAFMRRAHWLLLTLATVTVAGAVLGVHGVF
jgi:uncharacterized membrane protein